MATMTGNFLKPSGRKVNRVFPLLSLIRYVLLTTTYYAGKFAPKTCNSATTLRGLSRKLIPAGLRNKIHIT